MGLVMGLGTVRLTTGLGGFMSAQVLVPVRPISWVMTVRLEMYSLTEVGLRELYRGSAPIYVLFEYYWVCECFKLPFCCYDVIYIKIMMVLHSTL